MKKNYDSKIIGHINAKISYLPNPFEEIPICPTRFHPGRPEGRPGCILDIICRFLLPPPSLTPNQSGT